MQTDAALAALSALSHPHRLAAFRALVAAGPSGLAVGALRERLGIPAATLSAHLNGLRAARLVSDLREGRSIRVSADFAQMKALLGYLTENCCEASAAGCGPEPSREPPSQHAPGCRAGRLEPPPSPALRSPGAMPPPSLDESPDMNDPAVTIYHNPACGTSRNTLALIRNAGIEPRVVEYLRDPPDRATLAGLIDAMGVPAREVLRTKEATYAQLHLDDPSLGDDALIDAMLEHPILIQRPIVVSPFGTRMCRPSEAVLDLLPSPQQGPFAKEDGEVVIDAPGNRVV